MKKIIFVLPVLAILATATAAMAADDMPASGGGDKSQMKEQKFDERKSEILKRIDERLAKVQAHKACVSAATTPEALKACRPKGPEGRGKDDHKE